VRLGWSSLYIIDEVQFAVGKGYKILEIHDVYEYQVTQYNPETGEGELFVDDIITFFKLKSEASGYTNRTQAPKKKSDIFNRFGRVKESA